MPHDYREEATMNLGCRLGPRSAPGLGPIPGAKDSKFLNFCKISVKSILLVRCTEGNVQVLHRHLAL